MKTAKEINLAKSMFLDAFNEFNADKLKGVFIPISLIEINKQNRLNLNGSICFGILFLYLFYNAIYLDSIFYWHIDFPVIMGLITISIFLLIYIRLTYKYLHIKKILNLLAQNPKKNPFGVLLTDEFYFE